MLLHNKNTKEKNARDLSAGGDLRGLRRRLCSALLSLLATAAILACVFGSRLTYAVALDGVDVGYVKAAAEIDALIAEVETRASEILGCHFVLDDVTVRTALGQQTASMEALADELLARIDGISRRYVLFVDGQPAGAMDAREPLEAILTEIRNAYGVENAYFAQDVEIQRAFVNDCVTGDPAQIRELLNPENPKSAFALTVLGVHAFQYTETVPFDTEYVEDPDLYAGDETVRTEGVDGMQRITARSFYENGRQTALEIVSEYLERAPVTEVIAVGTAERPATASYGTYVWPTRGVLTSYFGPRSGGVGSKNHKGLDIAGTSGQEISAADGGEVIFAGRQSGYGLLVKLLHDNGDVTFYAHCSKLLVAEGQRVARGEVIAKMGRSGVASGVHLHFEIHPGGGDAADPLEYLPKLD